MRFVNHIEWPVVAFCLYLIKLLALGASVPDSIVMFPLSAVAAYHLYIKFIKVRPIEERYNQELKALEARFIKDLEILNSKVGSLQAKQQITQINTDPAKRYF
jgi:hypothetical protein